MSFSVSVALAALLSKWLSVSMLIRQYIHGKASRFLYRTLFPAWYHSSDMLSYNFNAFLVHFTGCKHYPCMHACIHACGTEMVNR